MATTSRLLGTRPFRFNRPIQENLAQPGRTKKLQETKIIANSRDRTGPSDYPDKSRLNRNPTPTGRGPGGSPNMLLFRYVNRAA